MHERATEGQTYTTQTGSMHARVNNSDIHHTISTMHARATEDQTCTTRKNGSMHAKAARTQTHTTQRCMQRPLKPRHTTHGQMRRLKTNKGLHMEGLSPTGLSARKTKYFKELNEYPVGDNAGIYIAAACTLQVLAGQRRRTYKKL